jgi:hypothetical protein
MGNNAFRDKVRFYESNKALIHYLTYEERIDVDIDYLLCLFEIGKYHKFLSKVDALIETVIVDNIFTFNGKNIYNDLLFKKAACLFNTGQYIKSEKVLKAIVKLDSENKLARLLFGKCKRKQGRDWYEGTKAIAVVMLISAVFVAVAELLIIKPFYSELSSSFSMLKYTCFILGIGSLVGNEMYLRYVVGREIGYKIDWNKLRIKIPYFMHPPESKDEGKR